RSNINTLAATLGVDASIVTRQIGRMDAEVLIEERTRTAGPALQHRQRLRARPFAHAGRPPAPDGVRPACGLRRRHRRLAGRCGRLVAARRADALAPQRPEGGGGAAHPGPPVMSTGVGDAEGRVGGPVAQPAQRVRLIIGALLLVLLLASLDQTIVSTALPTIVGELGGIAHLSWVVTAYLLASTVA